MELKLKLLEFIQSTISRFNNNCFVIKGWCATLVAAMFALSAKDANEKYILITCLTTIIFWILDAFYLSQERKFRQLYNKVASKNEIDIDFSMDTANYRTWNCSWLASFISKTLLFFYGIALAVSTLIFFTTTS